MGLGDALYAIFFDFAGFLVNAFMALVRTVVYLRFLAFQGALVEQDVFNEQMRKVLVGQDVPMSFIVRV